MITEVSSQNFNEKEKNNIFGFISPPAYCLNKSWLSRVVQIQAWTPTCFFDFSEVITKATQGQQNERSVYDVAFRKKKVVKTWSQKIKSQDQSLKLAPIELTRYQNCLTCPGALSSPILKRWYQRFPFKSSMKKRKRRFLGSFHPTTYFSNKP